MSSYEEDEESGTHDGAWLSDSHDHVDPHYRTSFLTRSFAQRQLFSECPKEATLNYNLLQLASRKEPQKTADLQILSISRPTMIRTNPCPLCNIRDPSYSNLSSPSSDIPCFKSCSREPGLLDHVAYFHSYLWCSYFPFLVETVSLSFQYLCPCHTCGAGAYVCFNQSARNLICKLFSVSCNEVDIIRESQRFCYRPLTVIVPIKPSNAFVLVCSKKMLNWDGDKIQLWRTMTVV